MTTKRRRLTPRATTGRAEIAEQAQAMMPEALARLTLILQTSSSDLAVLQAFRAIKETAYGKDLPDPGATMEFESLTDEELAVIAAGGRAKAAGQKKS